MQSCDISLNLPREAKETINMWHKVKTISVVKFRLKQNIKSRVCVNM